VAAYTGWAVEHTVVHGEQIGLVLLAPRGHDVVQTRERVCAELGEDDRLVVCGDPSGDLGFSGDLGGRELCRKLDPTRPVGFVNVMLAPYGKCRVSQFSDVLMLNRYYGWYVNNGDLPAAEQAWEQELRGWVSEGKPIIITEYGADTYPGLHAVTPTPWTEEHQVEYLAMNHRVFDRFEAVVGEQVWNFAGFATTPGVMRVGGNKKGVFTRDRQPKEAAWALRRRWCGAG
jgi:beta-galactosidase/beta-glucuronidase